MPAEVGVDGRDLRVAGGGRVTYHGALGGAAMEHIMLGTLEGTGPASLDSLRRSLIRWREDRNEPSTSIWVGLWGVGEGELEGRRDGIDIDYFMGRDDMPPSMPALFLKGDQLLVHVALWGLEEPDTAAAQRTVAPLLDRLHASCDLSVIRDQEDEELEARGERGSVLSIDIAPPLRQDETVADAYALGTDALTLLTAKEGEEIPRETALDLLRGGRWNLFVGQFESQWLDAKAAPYAGAEKVWKLELAKDVASFANSPQGGLIVLGVPTEVEHGREKLKEFRKFDLNRVDPSEYRQIVGERVFPEVVGFKVEKIEGPTEDEGVVVLEIPAQEPTSRPFIVQGGVVNGKVKGNYVLVPFRRADETASMDASAIQARLSLGHQALGSSPRIPSGG